MATTFLQLRSAIMAHIRQTDDQTDITRSKNDWNRAAVYPSHTGWIQDDCRSNNFRDQSSFQSKTRRDSLNSDARLSRNPPLCHAYSHISYVTQVRRCDNVQLNSSTASVYQSNSQESRDQLSVPNGRKVAVVQCSSFSLFIIFYPAPGNQG